MWPLHHSLCLLAYGGWGTVCVPTHSSQGQEGPSTRLAEASAGERLAHLHPLLPGYQRVWDVLIKEAFS